MRKLYQMFWDCGRMGDIDGLFVADEQAVSDLIGKDIYFGEVLGKHSDIAGTLEEDDLTIKSDDPVFINKLVEVIGSDSISGFNPFDYYDEDQDEEE